MIPHPNASDPRANPAQAHHMNVDYDELMYRFVNQENDPLSRTITLHPRSLAHGPKPGFDAIPIGPFHTTVPASRRASRKRISVAGPMSKPASAKGTCWAGTVTIR